MNNPAVKETGLRAESVVKTYQLERTRIEVLRGVTMAVQPGEIVSIMGASGAGKSTLLHALGGLDQPSTGRVFLDGEDVYAASSARRNLLRATVFGFVFQSFHLLPELDVLENVMLPALSRRGAVRRMDEIHDRGAELLNAVGLGHRLTHKPLELSGGEQQRAAIARALMNRPRYIMADEPTGNLDSRTGEHVLDILFGLIDSHQTTLVIVTHNAEVARRCNRRYILRDGSLADHGL